MTPTLSIKPGVRLPTAIAMAVACQVVASVYAARGYDCVITSAMEGRHGRASKHFIGHALDFRTRHVSDERRQPLRAAVAAALGPEFDVVLESDHLHVEYDPKEPIT